MTTVCDYAGIKPPPHAGGRSLRPLLEGNAQAAWRESVFAEMQMTTHLVRTPHYKYVKFYKKSGDFEKPFLTVSGEPSTEAGYSSVIEEHERVLRRDYEAHFPPGRH